jgi:hypothetical protein
MLVALVTSIGLSSQAQLLAGASAGLAMEWMPMEAFQGTQPIELPKRALTVGFVAEFGALSGFNFHILMGRGFGMDGPPLTMVRFDTALVYLFALDGVRGFWEAGTGLLQFQSDSAHFWRTLGWLGFGLRARVHDLFTLVVEAKRLVLFQFDNRSAPMPRAWVVQIGFLLGF